MNLYCFGLNHETAPVERREELAVAVPDLPDFLQRLRAAARLREAVALSTCNRVEIYVATEAGAEEAGRLVSEAVEALKRPGEGWKEHWFCLERERVVEQLFAVASGLKSMVVGETEILGQTKQAYETARVAGSTGKWLNRLFQSAFSAAKDARTHTEITRGPVSTGSVAVDLAERIFGDLSESKALLIGAGEISTRVAKSLLSRGVRDLRVTSRTWEHAERFAGELNGTALDWEHWPEELGRTDIVISSTSAPDYVMHPPQIQAALSARCYRPLFLIDLAVPRDIDPSVARLESVYLYDIDDLQGMARTHLKERELEIERCHALLLKHVHRFCAWQTAALPEAAAPASGKTADPDLLPGMPRRSGL
jgi:glutamyl-tRNA reductase